jgi:hypothetical protein
MSYKHAVGKQELTMKPLVQALRELGIAPCKDKS